MEQLRTRRGVKSPRFNIVQRHGQESEKKKTWRKSIRPSKSKIKNKRMERSAHKKITRNAFDLLGITGAHMIRHDAPAFPSTAKSTTTTERLYRDADYTVSNYHDRYGSDPPDYRETSSVDSADEDEGVPGKFYNVRAIEGRRFVPSKGMYKFYIEREDRDRRHNKWKLWSDLSPYTQEFVRQKYVVNNRKSRGRKAGDNQSIPLAAKGGNRKYEYYPDDEESDDDDDDDDVDNKRDGDYIPVEEGSAQTDDLGEEDFQVFDSNELEDDSVLVESTTPSPLPEQVISPTGLRKSKKTRPPQLPATTTAPTPASMVMPTSTAPGATTGPPDPRADKQRMSDPFALEDSGTTVTIGETWNEMEQLVHRTRLQHPSMQDLEVESEEAAAMVDALSRFLQKYLQVERGSIDPVRLLVEEEKKKKQLD